ncbi:MAG: AAA family ATPase [Spartobacteria bacterium]|nr:AAA family ATPase [Spartobacteria bacterium]
MTATNEKPRCGQADGGFEEHVQTTPGAVESQQAFTSYDPTAALADDAALHGDQEHAGMKLVHAVDWINSEPPPVDPVLVDLFDRGDKVAVIGASKTRKTWFLMQCALSLATGRDFLQWKPSGAVCVLMLQMEVKPSHFHRRLYRMAHEMGIDPESIRDRLFVLNGRGHAYDALELVGHITAVAADVVILDPLYKLHEGEENSATDTKPLLAGFDRIAQETGAAVVFCHHDAKGTPGDRNKRDRGSGSGVVGRDYDCGIFLTPHRDEETAVVVSALPRNYPPVKDCVAVFDQYHFEVSDTLLPEVETRLSQSRKAKTGPSTTTLLERVQEHLKEPVSVSELKRILRDDLGASVRAADDVYKLLLDQPEYEAVKVHIQHGPTLIGPVDVTAKEAKAREQEKRQCKINL